MNFYFLLLLLTAVLPIALMVDAQTHKKVISDQLNDIKREDPLYLMEGLLMLIPFSALFYRDDFWLVYVLCYCVILFGSGLAFLAAKKGYCPPFEVERFKTNLLGNPVLVIPLYYLIGFFTGVSAEVDEHGIDAVTNHAASFFEGPDLGATSNWIYYVYAVFLGLSAMVRVSKDDVLRALLMMATIITFSSLPNFSASFWWFHLFSAIGFMMILAMQIPKMDNNIKNVAGMIMPYFYMMAAMGSLMVYGVMMFF